MGISPTAHFLLSTDASRLLYAGWVQDDQGLNGTHCIDVEAAQATCMTSTAYHAFVNVSR